MIQQESETVVTKSTVVRQDVSSAFRLWTEQIDGWWPAGHSMSGDPRTTVIIEGKVNGRFYERTSDGVEYEWGRVVVWEPPHSLAHTWYLGSGRELPTRVDVRFTATGENETRITIEHRGPKFIGELWWRNKERYSAAWDKVLPAFTAVCQQRK